MKFNTEKLTSIAEHYKLQLIVLYGSHARDETVPHSDVDIAVLAEELAIVREPKNFLSLIFDLQTAMIDDGDIDLVILNTASPFFQYQVAMEGKPLYEQSEDLFLEFAIQAMKQYEDVRHFEKYYREVVEDFLKEHHDK